MHEFELAMVSDLKLHVLAYTKRVRVVSVILGMVQFHKALLKLRYCNDAREAGADHLTQLGTAYVVV